MEKITTLEQFNEKWEKFLKLGFYGMSIEIPEVIELMDQYFDKWSLLPDFQYAQIKMKFRSARVYADNVPQEELSEAEIKIAEICNRPKLK